MGHVIVTSIIDKNSAVAEISDYLQDECSGFILPETVQALFVQDVSGLEFFDFTDEKLRENFSEITYGQRKKIMKIVAAHPKPTLETLTSDLGCDFLTSSQGATDSGASCSHAGWSLSEHSQGESSQQRSIAEESRSPTLESYKIGRKRSKKRDRSDTKRSKNEVDPESVEPIDVLTILKSKKEGRDVIEFVRREKRITKSHQECMMRLLYLHVSAFEKSPLKYYPSRTLKISMAKGIVTAFPELRDDGDCPWGTWFKKVKTKFETVQAALPKEKKKYQYFNTTNSANSSSSSAMDEGNAEDSNTELTHNTTEWMNNAIPNPQNRKEISLGLKMTFEERARWIKSEKPSCTDILSKYKHLASYEGEMINEEFCRKEILAEDLVSRFAKVAKFICQLFEKQKSQAIVKEVYGQFEDVNLRALVALPKLLPPHLSARSTDEGILKHIKSFKQLLEKVPSSALLQIAPEGVDPEAYVSAEYSEEENIPIYPFLLWCTSDKKSGNLYLKIDRKTIRVATFDNCKNGENPVLKALSVAIKASHVFNLDYHPQMRYVFNYLEHLMCVNVATAPSVLSFVAALRELQLM